MSVRDSILKMATASTGNNEAPPALELRTGTVIAINKGVTPWTCTIRLSEADIPGITMLGWYDPVVGDTVQILKSGPSTLILGTLAPGKVYMPPAPPPPPPAPPAPPAPAPVVREVPVSAVASGTAPSQKSFNGTWSNADLYQGGGIAQRGFWFYGNGIAAAKGAGTIIGGSIFIRRSNLSAGVGAGANVRLGGHGFEGQPGGVPGVHSAVSVIGQLGRDGGNTFTLPQAIIDGMNDGSIKGLGLEPGALGYLSPDYLIAYGFGAGREWSGALTLTVRG
jgi:hypothetical protein